MAQSMSRVARCIDNGPIEGFWGIIKSEMYYLHKFQTAEGLKEAIDSYIDFYNHKRLQGRFHDQTPMDVRLAAIQAQGAVNQYPIAKNIRIEQYYASLQSKQLIDQDIYIAGQRSIEKKTYSRTSP